MEYPIQPDSLYYGDCRGAVAAKGKVMPSALSYGCKCQHFGQQHALLTAAKCPHALANLNEEFATIQATEQALNAADDPG